MFHDHGFVARAVRAALFGDAPAGDPEAHRLHLLARHLLDRDGREDLLKGIEYLNQALALDPEFALAWAELSRAHIPEADRGWSPVAEGYGRARGAIERSRALEPDLAEGHVRMGWICTSHEWDWRGAEVSFSRALEMAPGDATVLREAGILAWKLGRLDEATGRFRRALEQDPLNAAAYHSLGRGRESDEAMQGLIEGYAGDSAYRIAEALASRGEAEAAFEWFERAYAQRDAGLAEMKLDPHFRSLHSDPHWGTFLEKMGFEG